LVTTTRAINSERWIYLRALPEKAKKLHLVNHDLKLLALMDRLKGKSEDIDNLEEVIDLDKDMKIYQRNTLRKLKPQ
jgi:hypothetical protein